MSQTSISREDLKKNRTLVPLGELHLWEQNPREVIDLKRVAEDMQGVQTIPLLVMSDGTILGGNSRYQGMEAASKKQVWVSVIEFQKEGDKVAAYINGERDRKVFETVKDGMTHYALKNNQEYARYLQSELLEITKDTALNLDDYTFRPEDVELLSLKDLVADTTDTIASPSPDEAVVTEESEQPVVKSDNVKKEKISFNINFPIELVATTEQAGFEDWLEGQLEEAMLSLTDQFKRIKDVRSN